MSHIFPAFRAENYPRTYKPAMENVIFPYIFAFIFGAVSLPFFIAKAIKHGGVDMNFLLSDDGISAAGLLVCAVLVICLQERLTLKADSIEYRNFLTLFLPRAMKRGDIKGVRCVFYNAGKSGAWQTVFLPRNEKQKALIVSLVFKVDEFYDAWVGDFPFLEGKYSSAGPDEKDPARVSWNAYHHCWLPLAWAH